MRCVLKIGHLSVLFTVQHPKYAWQLYTTNIGFQNKSLASVELSAVYSAVPTDMYQPLLQRNHKLGKNFKVETVLYSGVHGNSFGALTAMNIYIYKGEGHPRTGHEGPEGE
jgi:hypothetical protein